MSFTSPNDAFSSSSGLIVGLAVEDSQNSEEEVDDIKIKADSGSNLLLDMVMAHNKLGIDQDITAEDEGGSTSVDELGGRVVGEESSHESEDDKSPERAEEIRHPRGKVVLGLTSEGSEEDEDSGSQNNGVKNDGSLVERNDDRDGVGFGESKE